jgi:hypothetical protein
MRLDTELKTMVQKMKAEQRAEQRMARPRSPLPADKLRSGKSSPTKTAASPSLNKAKASIDAAYRDKDPISASVKQRIEAGSIASLVSGKASMPIEVFKMKL